MRQSDFKGRWRQGRLEAESVAENLALAVALARTRAYIGVVP